ncbi:hypothetical protein KIPB_007890, partial [Kipferlia bialata]
DTYSPPTSAPIQPSSHLGSGACGLSADSCLGLLHSMLACAYDTLRAHAAETDSQATADAALSESIGILESVVQTVAREAIQQDGC